MDRIIQRLEPLTTPRRRGRMKAVLARRSAHVVFVFDRMVDPHNLSAVLRTMDAFSFQDAHLIEPQERVALARKITIGADRWLTIHEHADAIECLEALRGQGYRVLASQVTGTGAGSPPEGGAGPRTGRLTEIDFRQPTALVFGNEHLGLSGEVEARADGGFHIEMLGFAESFNLSVAAALCAFHARREVERLMKESARPESFLLSEARRREVYAGWLKTTVKRSEEILAQAEGG